MFTKEERLFIWEKVYEMIDRLEDGEYICVALRNREKIVRTEKEFDINGTKVMAYSRKDAIKRLKHKK